MICGLDKPNGMKLVFDVFVIVCFLFGNANNGPM
jgi:hypothetical protein